MSNDGRLEVIRTEGGHRIVPESEILRLLGKEPDGVSEPRVLIYARCSTHKQQKNLDRQVERLEAYCVERELKYRTFSEIGSGLNENRKQLSNLIKEVAKGDVSEVIIEYKDRLTRFGFKHFQDFFAAYNCEITVLRQKAGKTFEQELAEDLISLVTSHSGKVHRRRGGRKKKAVKENVDSKASSSDSDSGTGKGV